MMLSIRTVCFVVSHSYRPACALAPSNVSRSSAGVTVSRRHEAPYAFHGRIALLRGDGGWGPGREDDRDDQGKYVLLTHRHVVNPN